MKRRDLLFWCPMEKDSQRKQRGVMFGGWISSVSVFKRGCIRDQEVLYLSSEIGEPKLQYHYLAASSPLERNLVHFLSTCDCGTYFLQAKNTWEDISRGKGRTRFKRNLRSSLRPKSTDSTWRKKALNLQQERIMGAPELLSYFYTTIDHWRTYWKALVLQEYKHNYL